MYKPVDQPAVWRMLYVNEHRYNSTLEQYTFIFYLVFHNQVQNQNQHHFVLVIRIIALIHTSSDKPVSFFFPHTSSWSSGFCWLLLIHTNQYSRKHTRAMGVFCRKESLKTCQVPGVIAVFINSLWCVCDAALSMFGPVEKWLWKAG